VKLLILGVGLSPLTVNRSPRPARVENSDARAHHDHQPTAGGALAQGDPTIADVSSIVPVHNVHRFGGAPLGCRRDDGI
jgi:hypothetical protein